MDKQEWIEAAREWALENYDKGGDIIVEAYTDDELVGLFGKARTKNGALTKVKKHCKINFDHTQDIRGWGGEA